MQMERSQNWVVFMLAGLLAGCGAERATCVQSAAGSGASPYAGNSSITVPSLTAQEVDDLLAGRGLGLARAAELNGYPGPRHVLDLQTELGLEPDTVGKAEQLFQEMQASARQLGAQLVDLEKQFGEEFASHSVDEGVLARQVDALAALMGQLRVVHLRAHLRMTALLTADQIERYQQLRGYASSDETAKPTMAGSNARSHGAHHAQ